MSVFGTGDLLASRYRLLEELGGGGMGVVFRARDERDARDVAVKLLRFTTAEATRRIQREARATDGLDPARVARVYEAGETPDGQPFLVMEYVPGRTLRTILREGGVDRAEALRILREIAITLAAAHAAGLVHRDVKPDNVIVQDDGRVVLLDFGIVKHLDLSEDAAQVTTQLTSEGAMIGTPAYLAPEQALGREVGPAADQFSLAVTAFELLTGKLPWNATDVTRMLAQLLADTPPPASTLNRTLPRPFDAVLWRALSKSPEARFSSVEAFVDALDGAEHGVVLVSPASQTLEGPAPPTAAAFEAAEPAASHSTDGASPAAITQPAAQPGSPSWARRLRAAALLATFVALAGAVLLFRSRPIVARPGEPGAAAPLALVVSKDAPLACPILEVVGLPEVAPRLGAAAASLACVRAKWYLGGSDERILLPASLLDAPVQPRPDLEDFYDSPGARARTFEVVKARGLPSLEGTATRKADVWRIDLVVRAPGGGEIARATGVEAPFLELAIRSAVARLWRTAPLAPMVIDPEVARWTGYPDADTGLIQLDLNQVGAKDEACAALNRRGPALGRAYSELGALCANVEPLDAGPLPLVLDESSPSGLVTSVNGMINNSPGNPFSDPEMRRIASKLESMRETESSRFGRASLARLAGILWSLLHDDERAHAALLSAVADDPVFGNDWYQLQYFARGTGSSEAATSLAAVWVPQEPQFLRYAFASLSDALDARLRDDQLAYILEPTSRHTQLLGRALAEAGRAEEVRALIVRTPVDRSKPDPKTSTYLLGCIDLHDAMLARALERFEAAGPKGTAATALVAEVLDRTRPTATRWASAFVDMPDANAGALASGTPAAIALCMNAGPSLADRCLARVEKLGSERNSWGVGGDVFLRGAKRYAAGDVRGAVNDWRPIVASPNDDLARLLPTSAFERAGEPDLAARIDARKMRYRQFAGVSEAAPREARRAFARGDRTRAKELAKGVIQAWEVADAVIPAVAEMRALLAKIGD